MLSVCARLTAEIGIHNFSTAREQQFSLTGGVKMVSIC